MKSLKRGFTLIEQVVTIAAVGVASTTALPHFAEMRSQAETAALRQVAGAAGSAMQLNYGACLVTGQVPTAAKCVTINRCEQISALLLTDLPVDYGVTAAAIAPGQAPANGVETRCTITQTPSGASAEFYAVSAGN